MKIGLISIEDPRDVKSWSGIPYFVYQELVAQASDVVLISPLRRDFRYFYAPLTILRKIFKKRLQVDRHEFALASYARQIVRRSRHRGIDVYVALSSIPASRLGGRTPVVQWTDAVFECMPNYYLGAFASLHPQEALIAHRQEQLAIDRSTYAVYSSEWAASIVLGNYKTRPGQLSVIPFGSNLIPPPSNSEVNDLISLRQEKKCILLFVGVDWKRKGGQIALDVTEMLNRRGIAATLHVVGCAAPPSQYVRNLGFLDKNRVPDLQILQKEFREATFFLFPTRAEAAGIVLCEAASFGLPAISTATGGVATYVQHGKTGILLPPSAPAKDFADSIEALLKDRSRYRDLSHNSRILYENRLNWQVAVRELLHLCRKSLEAV